MAEKRVLPSEVSQVVQNKYTRSSRESNPTQISEVCFFCEKGLDGKLHEFCTFGSNRNVQEAALATGDQPLLAK